MTGDVLIVDDDRAMREVLTSACELIAVPCRTAADGLEALAAIEAAFPALIILDLMMPHMDGYATLEHLKACPHTADIPVIVYTAAHLSMENRARIPLHDSMVLNKSSLSLPQLMNLISQRGS